MNRKLPNYYSTINKNYIDKILAIGKKESCTDEEFSNFSSNLPDLGNKKFLYFLETEYGIWLKYMNRRKIIMFEYNTGSEAISKEDKEKAIFIVNLIKGIHIIEIKSGGVGSPTAVCHILVNLIRIDPKSFIYIRNWISTHGGDYYIEPNFDFEKARIQKLLAIQRMEDEHDKAVKRKHENFKRLEKIRNERELEIKKLEHLDELQKLRHIIKSLHPLDFYPNDFLDIDLNILKKLTPEEFQDLKNKSKGIHKKSPWKDLLRKIQFIQL